MNSILSAYRRLNDDFAEGSNYRKEQKNGVVTKFNIPVYAILHNEPMVRIKVAAANFRKENCRIKESFKCKTPNFNNVMIISIILDRNVYP